MDNLEKAKKLLCEGGFTCVVCDDLNVHTSTMRGVAPLLKWLDEGMSLQGFSAADKVVGKGAAYLYILLEVKEIYADVISRPALETLKNHNIPTSYTILTEAVRNRDNTGLCPIETAVINIDNPHDALAAIRNKLENLKNSR